jgi:putative acetyltransferase
MILRQAEPADASSIARLHRLSMRTAMPWLPDLHTPADDLAFFRDRVLPRQTVWVIEGQGGLCGYTAFADGWLHQLYVHPDLEGRGLGSRLLGKAMGSTASLQLWAFQRNTRARAFYESRGFSLVRLTDGAENEEREPDALYRWDRDA